MKYGAFAIVEVLGSANAIICVDRMLKTSDVHFLSKNTKCDFLKVKEMLYRYQSKYYHELKNNVLDLLNYQINVECKNHN